MDHDPSRIPPTERNYILISPYHRSKGWIGRGTQVRNRTLDRYVPTGIFEAYHDRGDAYGLSAMTRNQYPHLSLAYVLRATWSRL